MLLCWVEIVDRVWSNDWFLDMSRYPLWDVSGQALNLTQRIQTWWLWYPGLSSWVLRHFVLKEFWLMWTASVAIVVNYNQVWYSNDWFLQRKIGMLGKCNLVRLRNYPGVCVKYIVAKPKHSLWYRVVNKALIESRKCSQVWWISWSWLRVLFFDSLKSRNLLKESYISII